MSDLARRALELAEKGPNLTAVEVEEYRNLCVEALPTLAKRVLWLQAAEGRLGICADELADERDRLAERVLALEEALERFLDEAVARWHGTGPGERPLPQWLGMTDEEYAEFAKYGTKGLLAALAAEETG